MKSNQFVMAAMAAMFIAVGASAQDAKEVIEKYTQAGELVKQKKYAEALPLFEEVVTEGEMVGEETIEVVENSQKYIPQMYHQVGVSNAAQGKFDDAVSYLEQAVEKSKEYGNMTQERSSNSMIAKVYTAMASQAFNAKDYTKAAEVFAKGYAADPTDTKLALNLAMSYAEGGNLGEAFNVYNEIIALGQKNPKYNEAAATAQEKIEYYQTLEASKALEANDLNKAVSLLENIIAETPENAAAQMMLLQTLNNQKKYSAVIQKGPAAAAAQTKADDKSSVYFLIGAAYQNSQNNDKAIENYRKVTSGTYASAAKAEIAALAQ